MRLSTSLAAGGSAEKAAIIFRNHDVNQVAGLGGVRGHDKGQCVFVKKGGSVDVGGMGVSVGG